MSDNDGGGRPPQHSKFHFDNMHWKDPVLFGPILLYQIGDLACEGGYTTGQHKQFCYEISYAVSGKGVFSTDGVKQAVKKGDIYLNRPGEVHNVVADKTDPLRYFYAAFDLEGYGGETNGLKPVFAGFDTISHPVAQDKYDMQALFIGIFNELINNKEYSDRMIAMSLSQLVILAYRNLRDGTHSEYAPKMSTEHPKRIVYEVVNYIDSNLCGIVELADICSRFDYSYSYLSHLFSREMGMSLQEYFDDKRFAMAARWLAGGASVTEIAEKLQYQSIHTFSRAFRQHFGVSPTKYRNERRLP